jgi:hypothetical protein
LLAKARLAQARVHMEWYYSNSGVQSGPVSIEDLRAKVASGEVLGADLVWRDGMPDWMPASAVSELSGAGRSASAAVSGGAQAYPMAPQTSGLAIASLVCGLVGMIGFFACWVPGLVGIGGVICGHMALRQIKRNEAQYIGKGLAIGGLVTGYLATLCVLVSIIVVIGVLILGKKASDSSSSEIQALKQSISTKIAEDSKKTTEDVVPPSESEQ